MASRRVPGLVRVLAGILIGLAGAEIMFHLRDGGAFPHVNFYESDPELGVTLRPHAEERISFSGNPATELRTNALGFRGAEWGPPVKGELVVTGDSQVFGLGVSEDETFSAELARILKRPVLNGGVPTYGPGEYLATARKIIDARKGNVDTLILTLNMSNDLFEATRPNRDRHAVWDGWAVRRETAPKSTTNFPLRRWFMAESHAVFAVRSLWLSAAAPALGFPSEGGFDDLVGESAVVSAEHEKEQARAHELESKLEARRTAAQELRSKNSQVVAHALRHRNPEALTTIAQIAKYEGNPADIVERRNAEVARPTDITARALIAAAFALEKNSQAVVALAKQENDPELAATVAGRNGALERLREAEANLAVSATSSTSSPLASVIREAKALADEKDVKLVVVVLPLDVQVSAEEWKKYGTKEIDMMPTRILNTDAVEHARRAGAYAVDAIEALSAAEPGAFLHGDLHMTAKGHAAVAKAIAAALEKPLVRPEERFVLPPGRTFLPDEEMWRTSDEVIVKGSSKAKCETKMIREYFKMICRAEEDRSPQSIELVRGGHGEAYLFHQPARRGFLALDEEYDLGVLVPFLEGDTTEIDMTWKGSTQRLTLSWPKGGTRVMAFSPPKPSSAPPPDRIPPQYGSNPNCALWLGREGCGR